MRRNVLLSIFFIAILLLVPRGLAAAPSSPQSDDATARTLAPDAAAKLDPAVLAAVTSGKPIDTLIVMAEQADVSAADRLASKAAKGAYVFDTLRATAERTQAPIRARLEQAGVPYRAFAIANVIAVESLDAQLVAQLAARPEVGRIASNPRVKQSEPLATQSATEAAHGVEWNLVKIQAPKLWKKHIRGKGIVVANQDTGVDWTHPALERKYRGYDATTGQAAHAYNWWDAIHSQLGGVPNSCGYNLTAPCDDGVHGTHTMGIMVGSAGNNRIGVAPKAKWIACRNMDEGVGRASTYLECLQFFLAPWDLNGNNPDPSRAPDIVNNSWYCPASEGCDADTLRTATQNLRAAGIFVAVAAGNSGPNCSTIDAPASIYNAATTVGSTDARDRLSLFSSRGPITADDSGRRKPDLSAPGENIRSSIPGGGYIALSGTSMASPHVAGAVALLWQANPALRGNVAATERALLRSANPRVQVSSGPMQCGGTNAQAIPNNLFGFGRLAILRAYKQAR